MWEKCFWLNGRSASSNTRGLHPDDSIHDLIQVFDFLVFQKNYFVCHVFITMFSLIYLEKTYKIQVLYFLIVLAQNQYIKIVLNLYLTIIKLKNIWFLTNSNAMMQHLSQKVKYLEPIQTPLHEDSLQYQKTLTELLLSGSVCEWAIYYFPWKVNSLVHFRPHHSF